MEQALSVNPVCLRSQQENAAASVPSDPLTDQCAACDAAPMIGFHQIHFHSRFLCIGCDAQAAGVDEIFGEATMAIPRDDFGTPISTSAILDDEGEERCSDPKGHEFACTGTIYGGDDDSYFGEGRCYCIHCGADGDA